MKGNQTNIRVSPEMKAEMKQVAKDNGFTSGVSSYIKWLHVQFREGKQCITKSNPTSTITEKGGENV